MTIFNKINNVKNWHIAAFMVVLGIVTFSSGLQSPFMGDDEGQIVNNPVIDSLSHIRLFFEGGTFYNGQGNAPLFGIYYRPIMTTVFSALHNLFGEHVFYYHLFQLLLHIATSFVLYLFFKGVFQRKIALVIALIFLVHPLNSQTVFLIPAMQDTLFCLFGIASLYCLQRFTSRKADFIAVMLLTFSFFSKEEGLLFLMIALLYLWLFQRKRLLKFAAYMLIPLTLYLYSKLHAVGLSGNPYTAPIDNVSLGVRLLTLPSVITFYALKFVYPVRLATGYYWVHSAFTFKNTVLPLIILIILCTLGVLFYRYIKTRATKRDCRYYIFFSVWLVLGMAAFSQILPLDFTACESWAYFPIIGALGLVGFLYEVIDKKRIRNSVYIFTVLILILLLCCTFARGNEMTDSYTLASHNIVNSKEHYPAYNILAIDEIHKNHYERARQLAQKSVDIYPTATNENTLGGILMLQDDYDNAFSVLQDGLNHQQLGLIYENLAQLTLVHVDETPQNNQQFLVESLNKMPTNSKLWFYLAIQLYRNHDNANAKYAIARAADYGSISKEVYDGILQDKAFSVQFASGKQMIVKP